MKILCHRHTGIIVDDFDRMLEFYMGLGLVLRRRDLEEGKFINELLGTVNISLETAKLVLEDKDIPMKNWFQLELMKVNKHTPLTRVLGDLNVFNFLARPVGILDIAFTVDDIESVVEFILMQGGDVIGQPLMAVAGFPALHCYVRDPEGNVLHLAENRSGQSHEQKMLI